MKEKTTTIKPTHKSLAKLLGVTRQVVTAHASKPDAPKLNDVAGWQVFLAAEGRVGSLPTDLKRKIGEERLRLLREARIKAERENKLASNQYMPWAEAIRRLQNLQNTYWLGLKQMFRELPAELENLDRAKIFEILDARGAAHREKMVKAISGD